MNLFLLIIVLLMTPVNRLTEEEYLVYLPVVSLPRIVVEDVRPGKPEICMAWTPGGLVDRSREDFNALWFYHSNSHNPSQSLWKNGGIPVWRSPSQETFFLSVPLTLREHNYDGLVKLFNEPDLVGQDGPLSPQDAAALYRVAIRLLPNASFMVPNAVHREYTYDFFEAVGDDWRSGWDVVGVHGYEVYWTESQSPKEWLEPIIKLSEDLHSSLWVSEVGVDTRWSIYKQRVFVSEFDDPRVEGVCWYTTHCGGYSPEACVHNFYTDDFLYLTTTGQIVSWVVKGGLWEPLIVTEQKGVYE